MRAARRTLIAPIIFLLAAVFLAAPFAGRAAYRTPELKKFTAFDQAANDVYGFSVLVRGDWVFIGAPHKVVNNVDTGVVYIYERNTGGPENWGYFKTLSASDGASGDHFGISLDLDGDTLVVGAYFDDDAGNIDEGSAYIFQKDQGGPDNWGEVAKLQPFDGVSESLFGISVAISGDTAVIGARENAGGNGGAYLFERDQGGANAWGLVKKLVASNGAAGDWFGDSVSVLGDWVAAGARGHNTGNGAAYLFERNTPTAGAWGEAKIITPTVTTENIFFGDAVALDGQSLAVGAPALGEGGTVMVYGRDAGGPNSWGLVQTVLESSPEFMGASFGADVDLTGGTLVVGAHLDDSAGSNAGAVYVYEEDQGGVSNWGFVQKYTAEDAFPEDWLGFAVSADGGLLLAGAYKDDDGCAILPDCNTGAAYLFALPVNYTYSVWLPLVAKP